MNQYTEKGTKGFKKGNPGRPKGAMGWQAKLISELAKVAKKEKNIKALRKHFQELFDKNPAGFYLKFLEPRISKNIKIDMDIDGEITFRDWFNRQRELEQEENETD